MAISTHAPAGGATWRIYKMTEKELISTHAPAGGATSERRPHSRWRFISTHAPAGGATPRRPAQRSSNSLFLLTPLREGRRVPGTGEVLPALYFYSRPCGRGDATQDELDAVVERFLLTPLREGRPINGEPLSSATAFLLTPLREGRQQFSTSPS